MNGNSKRRPYTPKGWPTMTLARWWGTVGKPLQAQRYLCADEQRIMSEALRRSTRIAPRQARQEPQE